jgi:hypothetical protein
MTHNFFTVIIDGCYLTWKFTRGKNGNGYQFSLKTVADDGSCQFRNVSIFLEGGQTEHTALTERAVE